MKAYNSVVEDFKNFCSKKGYTFYDITEQSVIHFIFHLQQEKVSFAYMQKVKPALSLHLELGNKSSRVFTNRVDTILKGAKNLSAKNRPVTKKADPFPLLVLKTLVAIYIAPFQADPMLIQAEEFRAIFRAMIQYFTFCRFDCFAHLQEKHFTKKEGVIDIYFPTAKNDQLHNGNVSTLIANNSYFCPVKITAMYFQRFGLKFSTGDKYVNFRIKKTNGQVVAKPYEKLSYSTAIASTRKLLRKHGFNADKISEKSPKMEGVSQTLNAGASLEEVMWLGRWRSINTPNHYKMNDTHYKQFIAGKIPI